MGFEYLKNNKQYIFCPRGQMDNLFLLYTNLIIHRKKHLDDFSAFDFDNPMVYDGTRTLLDKGFSVMFNGYIPEIASPAIEYILTSIIRKENPTDDELLELTVAKSLLLNYQSGDKRAFLSLAATYCAHGTRDIITKLFEEAFNIREHD